MASEESWKARAEELLGQLTEANSKLEATSDKWVAQALGSPYTWAIVAGWSIAAGAVGAALFGCW